MKKLIYLTAALLVTMPVLVSSCARELTESTRQAHEKMLAAHVRVIHHDTLQKTESGLYYTVVHKGSGARTTDSSLVFVRETILDLNYNIRASTEESVARQLGAFSRSNAYIPLLWHMGNYSIMMGLEEMLMDMREGEMRRIWLPYWLSAYQEGGSSENTTAMVYDLELVKVVSDIDKYQIDTLESFRNRHYPGVDSLERGFYKVTLVPGTGDSVKSATTAKAWYIGKFLNGHVFDTNVADTAQKYRIYNTSKEYSILHVSMPVEDQEDDTSQEEEEGSVVKGFSKCMQDMKYGEIAVCFFHSDYGYKTEGKQSSSSGTYLGGGIPSYMPLSFWIYVPLNN
ncbi:MAG TPA: FKBP-type peptidyl-prolyl cis-trans isomerase [Bacteroidales bacterium]|nr:MAG: FKBP-type peptidyl-prolyl cis-trans isomerase [Bacteroidetes bacterium ADurb.Bin139]HOG24754.1 FKBP-type peptidyl-prolyl cis-trans isomerase [Bacteroidales bacterium]HOR10821.1 FKBP-type peptidyl-prolyl cis-trans isomerase [Bacteroidales bacterium]HPB77466.1 FKBP-type peptidyl-prolyl cis-trans isomerase [Bacteroidales bacterium]HQN81805.1 FKBP-type peptidyl-prolyl cis-trans isomerase [Bacteroidales bacterium]